MQKKVTTSIRLTPEVKRAAMKQARQERRSLSTLIEIALIKALQDHGVNIS
jgi:predicted HicB family RNase H-like nuclease